jgi:hypothetical protein
VRVSFVTAWMHQVAAVNFVYMIPVVEAQRLVLGGRIADLTEGRPQAGFTYSTIESRRQDWASKSVEYKVLSLCDERIRLKVEQYVERKTFRLLKIALGHQTRFGPEF